MSHEVDTFLAHYGVMGMKWGKHKKPDESTGSKRSKNSKAEPANPTSSHPGREARRKVKSDKILAKADDVQKQIDDLKKNDTNSEYMRKKYGDAIAIDSRSADMSVQFRHKHTKKELLDAEIKNLEASKEHFLADAKLASEGKLTQKEKMIIGAGIATVVLAGAVTYAVINDKNKKNQRSQRIEALRASHAARLQDEAYLKSVAVKDAERKVKREKRLAEAKAEQDRFDSIRPGDKITYDDYWKKIEATEMSRISGISKDAFDKMDETPISVPAGQVFKRVSTDKEEVLRDRIYATYKDIDNDRYKAVLPKFWGAWGIGSEAQGGYVVSIKAKEAINSPSEKERVKSFIELMGENITYKDSSGKDATIKGRQWMGGTNPDDKRTNEEIALATYRNFSLGLVNKTPISDAYFDKLKSKGFNAIIDDNDSGKLSDSPMLIFDTAKSMERIGATKLTPENIAEARSRLIEVTKRR
jgi:ASC-1-like (ASCH) protein